MLDDKAKAPEIVEGEQIKRVDESGSSSGLDDGGAAVGPSDGSALVASTSTSPKKKKKKKSKAAKALSALKGDAVPQAVVDAALERVKQEHGESAAGADESAVRMLLEQLKIKDVIQGKSGLGGKNKKDAGDHKVSIPVDYKALEIKIPCTHCRLVLGNPACTVLQYVLKPSMVAGIS